jgi:hypothetical protein
MAIKAFPHITTEGQDGGSTLLDRIVQSLTETFASLAKAVTNDRIVTVSLSTTPLNVYHSLPSAPTAIDVVGLNAGEAVYESATFNPLRRQYVTMLATGPVTAKLRFS